MRAFEGGLKCPAIILAFYALSAIAEPGDASPTGTGLAHPCTATLVEDTTCITGSGLKVKTLKLGTGVSPFPTSKVKVHYEGKLLSGKVFDSSIARGEPAEFPVNGVIAGWTEALQMVKPGAKMELTIPPELAYGKRGAPPDIPADATLIFFVELLSSN
jgi:FKBP-type peptidyl-prolyl cis-trans isomerase